MDEDQKQEVLRFKHQVLIIKYEFLAADVSEFNSERERKAFSVSCPGLTYMVKYVNRRGVFKILEQ